jgi:hypothetical protein
MSLEKKSHRGRTAVAVGVLGLVLGATGGAHAAAMITGKQIKDGTVTGRDLRNGSVQASDVADGSLTPDDYVGPVIGPPGPPGAKGEAGGPGVEYEYKAKSSIDFLPPGQVGLAVAECDPGYVAIGGGLGGDPGRRLQLLDSAPLGVDEVRRRSWVARAHNAGTINAHIAAWALCAEVR